MIAFESKGDFSNIELFLAKMKRGDLYSSLETFGRQGVRALANATPVESGLSAASWEYEIEISPRRSYSIIWTNRNLVNGIPVVILLQYGHGTGTGGYVRGRDFINPAIRPIFDQIADAMWKVVTKS